MWLQLTPWLEERARRVGQALRLAAMHVGRAAAELWRYVRPSVIFVLNIIAALLLLFEEWGWRPLSNLVARLARFPLWAMAELWIAGLPPYGALVALAVPSAILIPAKLLGVFLLATGHFITAAVIIVLAKLASTALIARIFMLTKPALMQIGWFARAYDVFVPWQEALFALIRESWVWRYGRVVKWRARNFIKLAYAAWRPRLTAMWNEIEPKIHSLGLRMRSAARDVVDRASLAGRRVLQRLNPPGPPR